jgi:hypothetical protein
MGEGVVRCWSERVREREWSVSHKREGKIDLLCLI